MCRGQRGWGQRVQQCWVPPGWAQALALLQALAVATGDPFPGSASMRSTARSRRPGRLELVAVVLLPLGARQPLAICISRTPGAAGEASASELPRERCPRGTHTRPWAQGTQVAPV